jgi:hypothetical protein
MPFEARPPVATPTVATAPIIATWPMEMNVFRSIAIGAPRDPSPNDVAPCRRRLNAILGNRGIGDTSAVALPKPVEAGAWVALEYRMPDLPQPDPAPHAAAPVGDRAATRARSRPRARARVGGRFEGAPG